MRKNYDAGVKTLKEFQDEYMHDNNKFDFEKFTITCKKCGSDKIEFGGEMELDWDNCYYDEDPPDIKGENVCKCHKCGNAFKMKFGRY